ncbi:MAG: tail fiber domain-containing protein [Bacteroidota bacterium]
MKKLIYIILLTAGISVNAQVAINTDNSDPDPSSMLDVKSIDKGLLLPRMTQAQRDAIITPAGGLMVFQTDNTPGLYYNSGSGASPVWVIAGNGSAWGLAGTSGTIAGTNFIGTTDDASLAIKVNNQPAGKIDHLLFNTSWGYLTLGMNTTGVSNTANGQAALFSNTTGNNNTAAGSGALYSNTTGYRNTANGTSALYSNTEGLRNTAIGFSALYSNITGNSNIAIGNNALFSNTEGSSNVATGNAALYSNTTGYNNTASGQDALYSNVTGYYNTAIGSDAMYSNNSGNSNTAIGRTALFSNTTGYRNTATGNASLYSNTEGYENTATGRNALNSNTTGFENTAIGNDALISNITGYYNSAIGCDALNSNTTGYFNTASGHASLYSNTTGYSNTAHGVNALTGNTGGFENTAVGHNALYFNTHADRNSALGNNALLSNTTGYSNTAIGAEALSSNTIGTVNTATGVSALSFNSTGDANTANGQLALASNSIGNSNTAIGYKALWSNLGGDNNTACGSYAGSDYSYNYCSFFGYGADVSLGSTNLTNSTALGSESLITASNQVRIGSSTVTSIGGYAGWSNIGDKRFKTDVNENVPGLAFINQLKPVTYHLDINGIRNFLGEDNAGGESEERFSEKSPEHKALTDNSVKEKEQITYSGFIAQDVEKAANNLGYDFSGVDKPKNKSSLYGLRYAEFVVPLVKAVQEQQTIIDNQNKKIDELIQRIELLENK